MATEARELPDCQEGKQSRRLAAWCAEAGKNIRLSKVDIDTLCCAASLFESFRNSSAQSAISNLARELGITVAERPSEKRPSRPEQLLEALQSGQRMPDMTGRHDLRTIFEHILHFDQQFEFVPYEDASLSEILARSTEENPSVAYVLEALRSVTTVDLESAMSRLPVCPAAALHMLKLLAEDSVSFATLEMCAKSDPILTGNILQVANSSYFGPKHEIRSVLQAIGYIGLTTTRQVLMAGAARRVFANASHYSVWRHSLEAAEAAQRISNLAGDFNPEEVFVLALLHDVGKITLSCLPVSVQSVIARLVRNGCQPALAEMAVCGWDHAQAGAETLRHWDLSEDWVEAIRFHHQPERSNSRLAALLYVTEEWVQSEEDIPSAARLKTALDRLDLTMDQLIGARITAVSPLAHLA